MKTPRSETIQQSEPNTGNPDLPRWKHESGVMMTEIDHEVALMSIELGKYVFLNQTASTVWRLLDKPDSVDGVVAAMLTKFDIDEQTCRNEVRGLFQQLEAQRLIERVDVPQPTRAAV